MDFSRRIAVCPARFGPEVVGGAERVLREISCRLAARGWAVDVLTTCATDHFRWDNVLPPGTSHEFGLPVRRFPAIVDTPGRERADWE
ncbi:MAG: hypothetical protein ACXVGG_12900, partial [Mycobacteriaceae bacterium]